MKGAFVEETAARTNMLVTCLRKGHWDEVVSQFDDTLAAALGPEQLAMVWKHIEDDAGPLVCHGPARPEAAQGLAIATSRLKFERAELSLFAVFNPDLTISGLTIRPVEATE